MIRGLLGPLTALSVALHALAPMASATATAAETHHTTAAPRYRLCHERPPRPRWLEEIDPKQAYRGLTLMRLYELRNWQAIAAAGDCPCALRYPTWHAAEAEYEATFADLSAADHTRVYNDLHAQLGALRHAVRRICQIRGNW